jgi:uncharacterized repeat protein (TIGR01451 family)
MRPADRPRAREGIVVRPVARLLLSAVLGGAAIFTGSPVTAATGYTVTDVGTLGGEWSDAQGINEAGDIAGTASRSTAGSAAYRWKGGLMTGINSFGGLSSQGLAISDDGWVVGSAQRSDSWSEAMWWAGADPHPMGTLGGPWSEAYAINDAHQIVGRSADATGQVEAFLWEAGTMYALGSLGPNTFSDAYGINNSGVIVGESGTADGFTHAFKVVDGIMIDLGTPSPNFAGSFARDINDAGTIVGGVWVENSYAVHPFVLTADGAWDVVTEITGFAEGINEDGAVVGNFFGSHPERAFVYENGVVTDLNTLIPAGSGWELSVAYDINDRGQIVGVGSRDGTPRGFLLNPASLAADLGVSLTAAPDPALAGTPVTFVATVTNDGPSDASSVELEVSLPVNHTAISCSADGGGVCSGTGATRTVTFPGLAAGADVEATFVVGSPASAADGASYGATATVDAPEADPSGANNSASASVTISNSADLALTGSANRDKVKKGQVVRYSFVANNGGPGAADRARFEFDADAGLDVLSVTGNGCVITGNSVDCELGTMTAGAATSITIDALATGGGSADLVSLASVRASTYDPDATDNDVSIAVRTVGPRGR